ncbi:DUF4157 domain-containing protein [Myxococcota bacterium]|nr:DUF4157 domain-containing protein [Myxococcota bacterium]
MARSATVAAPTATPATATLDATLHNAGNSLTLAALAGDSLDGLGPLITEALTLSLAGVSPEAGPGLGSNEAALVVMRHAQGGGVDHATLGGLRPGGGRPLPPAVVARLSAVFGHDLSHVRVHQDAPAARLAEAAQARAFTVGHEIWFNTGELDLTSPQGLELLLHELTHVIQADQGRAPRPRVEGVTVSSPHDPHEQEAERAAAALLPAVDLYGDGLGLEGDGLLSDGAWSAAVDLGPAQGPETTISREDLPTSETPQANEAAGARLLVMWEGETPLVIRAPEGGEAEDVAAAFAEAGATTCEDWEEVSAAEATYPLYYALMLAGESGASAIDFEGLAPVAATMLGETPPAAAATGGGMAPQTAGGGMSPGPWAPPGGQPAPFYVGNRAHDLIGETYKAANQSDTVFLNSTPVASIVGKMVPEGDVSKLSPSNAALRPDILNATKRCVYEIKPANAAAEGAAEAAMYVAAFAQAGVVISLGAPAMPGTSGVISGPGGFFQYDSPLPGVIVYRYSKQQPRTIPLPVPVPQTSPALEPEGQLQPVGGVLSWQYWEEITGLTGLALVTYLLISEGSRVLYPPRNLVPVP